MRSVRVFASALLLSLAAGCYTVLNHPAEVATAPRATETSADSSAHGSEAACSECHYESEWLGFFDHELIYGWPGLLAVDRNDWWFDYYRRPWWWDGTWYDDSAGGSAGGSAGAEDGESSWRKRIMRRADDPAPQAAPSGVFPGGAASPATGSAATGSPSADSGSGEKKTSEPESAHRKKDPRR